MKTRPVLALLVCLALALPMVVIVLLAVAAVLGAMQDLVGQAVVERMALAGGVLWAIDLVLMLVAVAISSLGKGDDSGD